MFTGIIEGLATVKEITESGTNIHFWLEGKFEEPNQSRPKHRS